MTISLAERGWFIQYIILISTIYTPSAPLFRRMPARNVQFLAILHSLFS